jgi:hypothetical protein
VFELLAMVGVPGDGHHASVLPDRSLEDSRCHQTKLPAVCIADLWHV